MVTHSVDDLLSHIVQGRLLVVALMRWYPAPGAQSPIVRNGAPVIARVTLSAGDWSHGYRTQVFVHKMWSMAHRFGYHAISDRPAVVRLSVDYLLTSQGDNSWTRLDVHSGSFLELPAVHLGKGDPDQTERALHFLFSQTVQALLHTEPPDIHQWRTLLAKMSALRSGSDTHSVPKPHYVLPRYSGKRSDQWNELFGSIFPPLRLCSEQDLGDTVLVALSALYQHLERIKRGRRHSIRAFLRPCRLRKRSPRHVTYQLMPLPKLHNLHDELEDALFLWSTETLVEHSRGEFSLAPQTRFVWCTREYVVLMDIRIVRDDWPTRTLLPDLYLLAVDLERELAYLLELHQLADGEHTCSLKGYMMEWIHRDGHLALMLALSNIRESVPHLLESCLQHTELVALDLPLPTWFSRRRFTTRVEARLVSDWPATFVRFPLLPERFMHYLSDVLHMFCTAAYQGVKTRVVYGAGKSQLIETRSPSLLGLASGLNGLSGASIFVAQKVYHKWFNAAFRTMDTSPWHVLAWRFFDVAISGGLKSRYARYLLMADEHAARLLLAWRTALSSGEHIPVASHLQGSQARLVALVPADHLGRRLVLSEEQYRAHVLEFDEQLFASRWSSICSVLDTLLKEDSH